MTRPLCPHCGSQKTRVRFTGRPSKASTPERIIRHRVCLSCSKRFRTVSKPEREQVIGDYAA